METISKQTILDTCQTGDILLYNGRSVISRAIEYATNSRYSHISIILRDPTYIDPKLTGLYIIESGMEDIPDSLTGKKNIGVQITPLEHAIDYYKDAWVGGLYYRKLTCDRTTEFENKIKNLVTKTEGVKYDLCLYDWIRAAFDIELGDIQITKRFWCSAFAAYIYAELGFLDKELGWSLIEPTQFSFYENKRLSYKNCELATERRINDI